MPSREWFYIQQKEESEVFTDTDSVPIVSENDEEDDFDDEPGNQQS